MQSIFSQGYLWQVSAYVAKRYLAFCGTSYLETCLFLFTGTFYNFLLMGCCERAKCGIEVMYCNHIIVRPLFLVQGHRKKLKSWDEEDGRPIVLAAEAPKEVGTVLRRLISQVCHN